MCEALRELFHDELEEAKAQQKKDIFLGLLREGLLSISDVAVRLNMTEAEVKEMLAN